MDLECVQAKAKRSFLSAMESSPPKVRATFDLQDCLRSQKPLRPTKVESKTINVEEIELRCGVR